MLDALEAELVPDRTVTQESKSDTESLRQAPMRRLVLNYAPDPQELIGEEERSRDLLFFPEARNVSQGLQSLDMVDLEEVFSVRVLVMRSVPKLLRGAYRGTVKVSLEEICKGRAANNLEVETRGGSSSC